LFSALGNPAALQTVGAVVPNEFLIKLAQFRVRVNDDRFKSGNRREVFEHFRRDRLAEAGVMRTAGVNPRRARVLEIRTSLPNGLRHRQLRHRLFGLWQ
jgi:hypothetical protein